MRILKQLFCRNKSVFGFKALIDKPEPWNADDARMLKGFLESPTGVKLRTSMCYDVYTACLSSENRDQFAQGMTAGKASVVNTLAMLCDFEYFLEESD